MYVNYIGSYELWTVLIDDIPLYCLLLFYRCFMMYDDELLLFNAIILFNMTT